MKRRIILFFLITSLLFIFDGCMLLHPSSKQKTEKKQAQESKLADKEYEKARKQHEKNQNKETIRMMKKTKKRSNAVNKYKKRSFFSSKECK